MHSPFANCTLEFFENHHREEYVYSVLKQKRFVTRTKSMDRFEGFEGFEGFERFESGNKKKYKNNDLDRTESTPGAVTLKMCARRKLYPVRFSFNFPQSCVLNLKSRIDGDDDVKSE